MKKRRLMIISALLIGSYVSGPFVAGSFRIGDRLGPVIYPESLHQVLYIIAHEGSYNEKPRLPLGGWMYDRPIFYGFSRRLKPAQEREAYIERKRQNDPQMVPKLIEMNQNAR
jgi:hypothetical protein